jgi:hypothetical protein
MTTRPLLLLAAAALTTTFAQTTPVFVPPATYVTNGSSVTGPSPYFSVAADFNGDGKPDLAAPDNRIADNIFGFSLVLSTPGGGFSSLLSRPVGFYVSGMRAADFNNDGRMDLLLSGGTATAIVFGNGDGTFSAPARIAMPITAGAGANCTSADLNNDGNQDILIPGDAGFAVALGNGNGTFRPASLYTTSLPSVYIIAGDFNNDGKVDALVNVNSVSSANMFLGNGDGTFQPSFPILAVPFGALTADFNNDGKLDLVYQTAQPRQDGSNFAITIALGQGTGSFLEYSRYVFPQPFANHIPADFNGDGRIDIATYYSGSGTLRVYNGLGDGSLGGVIYETPIANGPFAFLTTDIDSNSSPDLVAASYPQFLVFRNPRGNPPLPATLTVNPPSVIGGAVNPTATVTLGGPAPAPLTLVLASSDPNAFLSNSTVTVPAGASSASFSITTRNVAAPVSSDITATASGVTLTARLNLVPGFVLTNLAVNPASQYGIFASTGTATLNGPAASSTIINLASSNSAIASVPASVIVPAGASAVDFPISLSPVAADTPATISATFDGVTKTAGLTVLKPLDVVAISKSQFNSKTFELRLEAASTSAVSTLTVYNTTTGALIGTLRNAGSGKYDGAFTTNLGPALKITLKSTLGGTTSATVPLK